MGYGNSRSVRFQDDLELPKLHNAINGDGMNMIKLKYNIDGTKIPEPSTKKDEEELPTSRTGKSLKAKVLSMVFSDDFERVKKKILDPQGPVIRRWNKIFLVSCIVSLFVDPLFFYLPVVWEEVCIDIGIPHEVILTIVRSLVDAFYIIQIFIRFRTAYVAPPSHVFGRGELVIDSRKIASRYLQKSFRIDLIVVLPLPQVFGASWYLLAIERQEACWRSACDLEESICQYKYFDCHKINDPGRDTWFRSSNITGICSPNFGFYQFGTYSDALTFYVTTAPFFNKYFYCLWWGLRNLSSLGQNLDTSTYVGEIIFAIIIATLGLVLFALLIGNMQYKWLATRGVDEEALLKSLPLDLRRDIKRHLGLDLMQSVRLKPALCTEGTILVREGDPVNKMLFIIRGHLDSYSTNGGRTGFFNSCKIGPGDFCAEAPAPGSGWAICAARLAASTTRRGVNNMFSVFFWGCQLLAETRRARFFCRRGMNLVTLPNGDLVCS
ncbi:putative cyclic nucleotide-gated ion channel 15 [Hibiscus syriacus]|uniref:Cyclic nucleotide-gated ion channel 15 n=1 Tax=Hibiscus syriacus TaxID=106335 RepID=A0A6A3CK24_HIBSY|nr:putative cyclic nucleotide-gated ion channel 15 [Hibiscus syriacus]